MGEANGTMHSALYKPPHPPAQSNKLGSSIIVLSQLKPTTIDTTVQHGMDGGMAIASSVYGRHHVG